MSEKTFKSRVILKHDVESNWQLATGFTPLQGEVVIYDPDKSYAYSRFKIGDGEQNVNALPFVDDALRETLVAQIGDVDDKVDAVSALVGDTAVSAQISSAIDEATADDFGIYVQDTEPADAVDGDIWIDTANDPSFIEPNLPEVTEADNGKILMVVNGTWQAVALNMSVDANGVLSV